MDTTVEAEESSFQSDLVESKSVKLPEQIQHSNNKTNVKEKDIFIEEVKPTEEKNQSGSQSGINETTKVTDLESNAFKPNEPPAVKSSAEEKANDPSFVKDESNIHYEGEVCVYTDPASKYQYTWDVKKEEWCHRTDIDTKDYKFDGKTYAYFDEQTNKEYIWDIETNSWKLKQDGDNVDDSKKSESEDDEEEIKKEVIRQDMSKGQYGYENDTHTYTDTSDGTVYLWDKEKSAWFPKVDDDFLAQYQMSYGFVDPETVAREETVKKEVEMKAKEVEAQKLEVKRKAPQEPTWFDVGEDCTKVYVSNLPLDLTEQEFIDLMQKCGLVMKDVDSGRMKVKLYTEPATRQFKGDALCSYIKKESVDLALDLLDGYIIREKKIKVEKARFTMKGDAYDASLKPKKKRKKDKEKMKKIQEKLFDWRPDKLRHERGKNEKVVIVKNLFDPEIFNNDVALILEYQQDLNEESLKCGAVRRVIIYDRHPEGVAQINFKEAEAADACVQLLNNRWFGKRQITAETWDGKTKYKVFETEEEVKKRLENWTKFLESGKDKDGKKEETVVVNPDEEVESENDTRSSAGSQDETEEELSDHEDSTNKNVKE